MITTDADLDYGQILLFEVMDFCVIFYLFSKLPDMSLSSLNEYPKYLSTRLEFSSTWIQQYFTRHEMSRLLTP